jgi:hypothetical protein
VSDSLPPLSDMPRGFAISLCSTVDDPQCPDPKAARVSVRGGLCFEIVRSGGTGAVEPICWSISSVVFVVDTRGRVMGSDCGSPTLNLEIRNWGA